MPFELKERRAGPVLVLELAGRLTMGLGSEKLDEVIQALIGRGERAVLLDCAAVPQIDSQGIQALVRSVTSMANRGGKLKLLKLSPRVREVLDLTRLLTVIEAFEDEQVALRSF